MAELKPCPFCGSIPFMCVNKYRHDQFTYSVKCSNSACDVIPLTYECSEETQAISNWNKRVDAYDVKHGEWIIVNNRDFEQVDAKCSICGYTDVFDETGFYKYCPNCGAKMDLKEGAEE